MTTVNFSKLLFFFSLLSTAFVWASPLKEYGDNSFDVSLTYLEKNLLKAVGQSIFLKPEGIQALEKGSSDFIKDISKSPYNKKNQYTLKSDVNTRYKTLSDKNFTIVDAFELPHPKFGWSTMLKLQRIENGEIFYYRFKAANKKSKAPFLLEQNLTNRKKAYLGTKYILRKNPDHKNGRFKDINTGKYIEGNFTEFWTCADMLFDQRKGSPVLVLINSNNQMVLISSDIADNPKYMLQTTWVEKLVSKFGEARWNVISKGRIQKGMTKNMVHLSLGTPAQTKTIDCFDQWTYENRFLYFKDGILFKIR